MNTYLLEDLFWRAITNKFFKRVKQNLLNFLLIKRPIQTAAFWFRAQQVWNPDLPMFLEIGNAQCSLLKLLFPVIDYIGGGTLDEHRKLLLHVHVGANVIIHCLSDKNKS